MAERRMFSKRIISSDAFMDMCASAQMLYFHLSMWADDEGFVNNPKTIQRMCGATSEDMSVLTDSGLVIRFESGIVAITHWKTHNYIRGDRIKPTYCAEEKAQLCVSEDGIYALAQQDSTNGGKPVDDDNEQPYSDYGAEDSANSGAGADNSAQAENSTLNGSGTEADNSAQAMDSAGNGNGAGAECYAQAEDSALNGNGERADNSAQAKDSTLNGNGTGAESYAQAVDSNLNGSGTEAESSTLNGNGAGADNSAQANDSTLNGNGTGAESSAQAESSTLNGSGTGAESYAQAKDSSLNGNSAGADNSAQAKDSTRNGNNNTQAEDSTQDSNNGNNNTQAEDSTRKSESCDRATLIERYGIDNVLDYEERFRKWSEKRGRQGMPLYPTISAWMKQDNVVNRREYSSIPDYYLSDDFLLEGY